MNSGGDDRRPVVAVTGLAVEARIAAGDGVQTLAGGGDAGQLKAALERALAQGARAFLSFGISGGLAPSASPGAWVIAESVVAGTARWPVDRAWAAALAQRLPDAMRGDVAGSDSIVVTMNAKRALGAATGAVAVDTESHVVAAFAAAHGVPFAVFRVVADTFDQVLAPATLVGMRSDGTVDQRAVLASILRNPGQLRALVRNALAAQTAFRSLSRGRRLLGLGLGYPDLG